MILIYPWWWLITVDDGWCLIVDGHISGVVFLLLRTNPQLTTVPYDPNFSKAKLLSLFQMLLQAVEACRPSGNLTYLLKRTMYSEFCHSLNMVIFHSYVKLPEGILNPQADVDPSSGASLQSNRHFGSGAQNWNLRDSQVLPGRRSSQNDLRSPNNHKGPGYPTTNLDNYCTTGIDEDWMFMYTCKYMYI